MEVFGIFYSQFLLDTKTLRMKVNCIFHVRPISTYDSFLQLEPPPLPTQHKQKYHFRKFYGVLRSGLSFFEFVVCAIVWGVQLVLGFYQTPCGCFTSRWSGLPHPT